MADQFWSSNLVDPKRSFRFVLVVNNMPTYTCKTSGKPSFTINNITHNYMAHAFNYPGRITWNPVSVTLVDPVVPDASAKLNKILQASGYAVPNTPEAARVSFTKKDTRDALGSPSIQQLDASGRTIEQWTLRNAWIESVNFGNVSYDSDEMVNIELSFRYDWAEYYGEPGENGSVKEILGGGKENIKRIKEYRKILGKTGE
jgi:hypothetical protein